MKKIKVLLAEDHKVIRQGIRRLLEDEGGFDIVGEAGDGYEAVRLAIEKKPDVVIMDIAMPKLNGVEATGQIKERCPTTAVLVLSAYDDGEYVFGILDVGVAGFLLKTASGDELVAAVEAAHDGESVLDRAIIRKMIERFKTRGGSSGDKQGYETLSDREIEVLECAARGMSNQEIAGEIMISKRTVEGYMRSIFNKLGVGSRTEAVIYGFKKGWFALSERP